MSGLMEGIDISHHNYNTIRGMTFDWLRMKASEGFVIMKATEGKTWTDPKFNSYMSELSVSDDPHIGIYHYARPELNKPAEEAENFLSAVTPYMINRGYVLALDVEGKALAVQDLDAWCREWLDLVYCYTGIKPLVYCQRSALKLFKTVPEGDYGLWLAAWTMRRPKDTKPWPFMAMWQYSALGIDKDFFFGSPEQWDKYAGG